MTRLSRRPFRQQQPLLAACTSSASAVRTAPIATTLRPTVRPEPGIAAEVLFDLRADDARDTSFAAARALLAMPMHDPAEDPQPIAAQIERARYEMQCRDIAFANDLAEDRRLSDARCTLIAAAAWVDDAAGLALADDCAAVLDAVAARPELRHEHALLMYLAPIVAWLKGLATVAADELPDWIRENVERPKAGFRAAIHRTASGAHLTSIEPNVCYDEETGEPSALCHFCDEDDTSRRDFSCWAPASSLTVLTVVGLKGQVA